MSANDQLVESQLSTLQLLQAMYPLPSELSLTPETEAFVAFPASSAAPPSPPSRLEMELHVRVDEERSEEIELSISLPLFTPSTVLLHPRQPPFLPRAIYEDLLASVPPAPESQGEGENSEYILSTIENIKDFLRPYLPCSSGTGTGVSLTAEKKEEVWTGPEERVWFWFPSLSTKEKREDLVNFASEVGLTGFVLAGKPGLLCVEGQGTVIDKYMSRIKSESWSDIPPFQKKVTERLRRPLASRDARAFKEMQEITHMIPKYGQYAHRGDMSEVKRLMDLWGVGEDFGGVVLNNGG